MVTIFGGVACNKAGISDVVLILLVRRNWDRCVGNNTTWISPPLVSLPHCVFYLSHFWCISTTLPIPEEMYNLYKGFIADVVHSIKETQPRAQGWWLRVSPEIRRSKITQKCPNLTHLQVF